MEAKPARGTFRAHVFRAAWPAAGPTFCKRNKAEMSESERRGPLWDIMEGRRPLPAVARLLGSKVLSIDPDGQRVKLEFLARPEFLNVHGMVQGGLLSAMFDDAMAAAVTSSGGGFMAPTLELKTSFIRPARQGPLFVEGWVVHRGRSIAFLEGQMHDTEGNLIAMATATSRIMELPPDE
jgi:uncharacterized protein (TIGR00369 family)